MSAPTIRQLEAAIAHEYEAWHSSDGDALQHAVRLGKCLQQAKHRLPHGGWIPWVRDHCPFDIRAAQHYMQVCRYVAANAKRVTHLTYSEVRLRMHQLRDDGRLPPYSLGPDGRRSESLPHDPPYALPRGKWWSLALPFQSGVDREAFCRLLASRGARLSDPVPTLVAALKLLPEAPAVALTGAA